MKEPLARDRELQDLAADYLLKARSAGERIAALWNKLSAGDADRYIDRLIISVHNLAGSAASYGLEEIAALAARLEAAARAAQRQPQQLVTAENARIVEQIRQQTARIQSKDLNVLQHFTQVSDDQEAETTIYIVDDDQDQAERLALQLASHGFQVHSFTDLQHLREAVLAQPPDAIVSDIVFPEGGLAGIEAIAALRNAGSRAVPVVFISSRGDSEARLQALRAGGSGYFTKPVALPSLASKLHQLTNRKQQAPYRIMIVDDDATSTLLHAAILRKAGCEVETINDPLEIIAKAIDFRPELIFLDLYMPQADGLEVATMLRQEELFLDVPIVFLSGENDESIKERAIKEGASSFLQKPVSPGHLAAVAQAHAQQYRTRSVKTRYLGRIDPDTGLFTRDYLFSQLDKYCSVGRARSDGVAALLMLEIDHFSYLLRTLGEDRLRLVTARIANLVRSCMGTQDLAGTYTDSSFLVLTIQPSLRALEKFAGQLIKTITGKPLEILGQQYKISVSIGISKAANNQNQILSEAALACSLARKEGGNKVLMHSDLRQEVREDHQMKYLRHQIKNAIKNRRIVLEYSPVVGLTVEQEERYSVLMRLRDDEGRTMYPAQFMPVAQKYNLLPALDRWALMTALRSLQQRQREKLHIHYFVKLSRESLLDTELPGWIARAKKKYRVQPGSLILEIKEDDIVGNLGVVVEFVEKIKALDCGLSIERFGVSMDAFELLPNLEPEYLRLAPALLENLSSDDERRDYLHEVCERAHDAEAKVLAAYIQDSQTLSLLWQLGVDYIQGDFLEQPRSMELEIETQMI